VTYVNALEGVKKYVIIRGNW